MAEPVVRHWIDWDPGVRGTVAWFGGELAGLTEALQACVGPVVRSSNESATGEATLAVVHRASGFPLVASDPRDRAVADWGREAGHLLSDAVHALGGAFAEDQTEVVLPPGSRLCWILPLDPAYRGGHLFGPEEGRWLESLSFGEANAEWRMLPRLGVRIRFVESTGDTSSVATASEALSISAVVLTRGDRPDLLEDALLSVRNQTRPANRVLLAEDGDSEASRALASRYGFEHLPSERGPRGGQARIMNRALGVIETSHVAWLDDDDRWAPTKLFHQEEAFRARPGLTLHGTRYAIQDLQGTTVRLAPMPPVDRYSIPRILLHGSFVTGPSCLVDCSLYERAGNYDESLDRLADHDFLARAWRHGPFDVHPLPLTWVRSHSGNRRTPDVESRILDAARQIHATLRETVSLEEMFPDAVHPGVRRMQAFLERGAAALRAGCEMLAESDFREATRAEPRSPGGSMALATLYLGQRKLDRAEVEVLHARDLAPRDGRPWIALGAIHHARSNWEKAEDAFAKAMTLDPTHPVARSNLILHRFGIPGLGSPLHAEVEALVRDLLLRLRPPDLGISVLELDDVQVGRPFD